MKIPSTFLIEDTDFHSAWSRAIRYVVRSGTDLVIGDTTNPKPIRDIVSTIVLTGNAIKQIECREIHKEFPFKFVNEYCHEFTREYHDKYIEKDNGARFSYMYYDRFVDYFGFDQLSEMRYLLTEQINTGISSNRNQITTWHPYDDMSHDAAPCLQSIWCRYIGDHAVELHWHFRSNDLYSAWQANVIALTDMINTEVVMPNRCKIVQIVHTADSLHIYDSDLDAAKKVKLVPTQPNL